MNFRSTENQTLKKNQTGFFFFLDETKYFCFALGGGLIFFKKIK